MLRKVQYIKVSILYCLFLLGPLLSQSASGATKNCDKWFEKNIGKIRNDCPADCATIRIDMGTFQCHSECPELCAALKKTTTSEPGRFILYPGLTPAERKLIDKNPKEAIAVFVAKSRAEISSTRNFPVQGFINSERAQIYLDAHEENRLQPTAERAMELANNRGGILAAQKLLNNGPFELRQLEQQALDDLRSHRLVILNPGLSIPKEPL